MAFPTSVNSQITDAVTQSNVMVLGASPAQALGTVSQVAAQAAGLSMQNAVSNQQAMNQINSAIVTIAVKRLLNTEDDD